MKQYLLIPIEEIGDIEKLEKSIEKYRLDEHSARNNYSTLMKTKCINQIEFIKEIQSKGEIVEIENNELTDLFKEYSHSNTKQTFESFVVNEKGYKIIKTIKQ